MSYCPNETEWMLYADGELPAARQQELQEHLAGCETCRREAARIARGMKALATLSRDLDTPMRPEAMATLRRRLRAAAQAPTKGRVISLTQRWPWAAAAAAILLVAAISWSLWPTPPAPNTVVTKGTMTVQEATPIKWTTDEQIQKELTEINATLEMMEYSEASLPSDTPAAAPSVMDEWPTNLDQLMEYLRSDNDA
jgi:hypothetical protein